MKYKVILLNKNAAGGTSDNVRAGTIASFYKKSAAESLATQWVETGGTCWLFDGVNLFLYQ